MRAVSYTWTAREFGITFPLHLFSFHFHLSTTSPGESGHYRLLPDLLVVWSIIVFIGSLLFEGGRTEARMAGDDSNCKRPGRWVQGDGVWTLGFVTRQGLKVHSLDSGLWLTLQSLRESETPWLGQDDSWGSGETTCGNSLAPLNRNTPLFDINATAVLT